jgi:DNA-binding beta-propeller fold protein YncE
MKSSSGVSPRLGLRVVGLVGLAVLCSSSHVRGVETKYIDGGSRLVAVSDVAGEMCELPVQAALDGPFTRPEDIPVNPVTVALGMNVRTLRPMAAAQRQGGGAGGGQRGGGGRQEGRGDQGGGGRGPQAFALAAGAPLPGPPAGINAAKHAAVRARTPIRRIYDRYPQYSAVAVDPNNDEVVLQDENQFQIQVFNRTTNTPRTATTSEPKRAIQGENTYLELNCALYIDPKTGNIYTLNNDTERSMTVWDRSKSGDAEPTWKLRTPMGSFGLAVDEDREELLITAQHEQVVAAYSKTARENDLPNWVVWGDKTELADPHGIAIDTKQKVYFVANFGNYFTPRPLREGENVLVAATTRFNMIPGSGRYLPPSINVYPLAGRGNIAPVRKIVGPATQLNWPTGLFMDSDRGELYVANDGGKSVLVFSATAEGNVAPIRVIKGPKSKLVYPTFVFLDQKNGELWVADMGSHRASVFPRTANGDVAPIREIRSAPDGTPSPTLANVRIGYDSKRDQILAPN